MTSAAANEPRHDERVTLLDLTFDPVTFAGALETCLTWCKAPRTSHTVITVNAAILCMMRRDPELAHACRAGDLIVPDGVSVVWASRLTGAALPERIAGVDFMGALLEAGSRERLSVYFLGARAEVLSKLVERCQREFPGLSVAGFRDGYFGPDEHERIVEDIRSRAPHFLFVGMPTPFKEIWCQKHRERLNVPVIIGVGGSFDVHAGYLRRAPQLLQNIGMEWSWRLALEPRKMWRRYLTTNSEFLWLAGREALSKRLGRRGGNGVRS